MCPVMGGSGGIKDLGALQCHDRADYIASNDNVVCLSLGHTLGVFMILFSPLNCVLSILLLKKKKKPYKSSFGIKNL